VGWLTARFRESLFRLNRFAVVGEQFFFLIANRGGVLTQVTGVKHASRKAVKLLGLNGDQKPRTDFRVRGNLFQRNPLTLTDPRQVQ